MSRQHLTEPFMKDGRLKVFWLDDKGDDLFYDERDLVEDSQRYSPWFAITSATELADLRIIRDEPHVVSPTHEYDRLEAPYDVYVLDFKLCDGKEHCRLAAHIEEGIHAPAAGLVGGIFTAATWPTHPQALIPYSAYPEEIGDVWKLCWQFRSPEIHLAEAILTKEREDVSAMLESAVAPNYRKALASAFETGVATIPMGTLERFQADLDEIDAQGLAGEPARWIAADTEIEVSTAYGLRNFKLGALFFDRRRWIDVAWFVPVSAVRTELLAHIPPTDPIVTRARELAELFWHVRATEQSHRIYTALRRGEDPVGAETAFPWIGDPIWRPSGRAHAADGLRMLRLAILFSLVFEHQARVARGALAYRSDALEALEYLDSCFHRDTSLERLVETCANRHFDAGRIEELVAGLEPVIEASRARGDASALDLLTLRLPLSELDVVQLLDPLAHAPFSKSLSSEYRVGGNLARTLLGSKIGHPTKTLDLAALLIGDANATKAMLLEIEWAAVTRFAAGILKQDDMPTWLSNRGHL